MKRISGKGALAMKTMEQLRTQLEALKVKVHRDYGVSKMEVFGSYVRGEQREDSDLDVLVEFDRDVSLLDLVGFEQFVSDTLGVKVDAVPRRSVREELRGIIFSEAVQV
jgi:uncharacterized protein